MYHNQMIFALGAMLVGCSIIGCSGGSPGSRQLSGNRDAEEPSGVGAPNTFNDANTSSLGGQSWSTGRVTATDPVTGNQWMFWSSGTQIRYGFVGATGSFQLASAPLPVTASRFSTVSKQSLVFIVYESNFDVMVLRGKYAGDKIGWETPVVALDGHSLADTYYSPASTIGADGTLYVGGFHSDRKVGGYVPTIARTAGSYAGALQWNVKAIAGANTLSFSRMALVPQGASVMAITTAREGSVLSYAFDGTQWNKVQGSVGDWSHFLAGATQGIAGFAFAGPYLYVAGSDSYDADERTQGIRRWDGVNWMPVGEKAPERVQAIAAAGSDVYVGGEFKDVGGTPGASSVARWDGAKWQAVGSALSCKVLAIAFHGSNLYVGGYIPASSGMSSGCVAKWDGSRWSSLGAIPGGSVTWLTFNGADIYAGGHGSLLKWDGATWQRLNLGIDYGSIYSVAAVGKDLYLGGRVTLRDCSDRKAGCYDAVLLKWDGSKVTPLPVADTDKVVRLVTQGQDLHLLIRSKSDSQYRVAKWSNGAVAEVSGPYSDSEPTAFEVRGSDIFVGGSVIPRGSSIMKWDGNAWEPVCPESGTLSHIRRHAFIGKDLYFFGQNPRLVADPTSEYGAWKLVKFDGSTWSIIDNDYDSVSAMQSSAEGIYMAGELKDGQTGVDSVKRFDGAAWTDFSLISGFRTEKIVVDGAQVFVGGAQAAVGNTYTYQPHLAFRWSGSGWEGLTSRGIRGVIFDMGWSPTLGLVMGGQFGSNYPQLNYLARWSGKGLNSVGPTVESSIETVEVINGEVYIGGYLPTASGSMKTSNVAKLSGGVWEPVGTGIAECSVQDIKSLDGSLYISGNFKDVDGVPGANHVARLNGTKWEGVGDDPPDFWGELSKPNNVYSIGGRGFSILSPDLVAKALKTSAASSKKGVHLAFTSKKDFRPYYITFNGTSWSAPVRLLDEPVYGSIAISTNADGDKIVVAWERQGAIEYTTMTKGSWSKVATASNGKFNYMPSLPETLGSSSTTLAWFTGGESAKITAATISVP